MEKEIFKGMKYFTNGELKDYSEFYVISNLGKIKGVKIGKILKTRINERGYEDVRCSVGNKKITVNVHRAVASTFLFKEFDNDVINHKDSDKKNNNVNNLEWCTQQHNVIHAINNGTFIIRKGVESNRGKLNKEQIKYIKEKYIFGSEEFGTVGLSNKFNVNHKTIWRIVNKKTYIND